MKTIWKFELQTTDLQSISMPEDSKILWLSVQRDEPCVWAEVNSEAPKMLRQFVIYGTGHPMGAATKRRYLGSYMLKDGALVFHVYELL